jgi:beta-lactamase superfamily II metal-dependent hydrolase
MTKAIARLVLVIALGVPWRAAAATVSGDLQIHVLNIGQGDAILVICPHGTHRLLIDAAAQNYTGSTDAFKAQMRALVPGGTPTLQVVVSTHPHRDHLGGLKWVLENFKVKKFIDSGGPYGVSFATIPQIVGAQSGTGQLLHFEAKDFPPSRIVDFCPATNLTAEVLVPSGYEIGGNPNNNSVVVLITYGSQTFLFTGDAEKKEERLLLNDGLIAPRLANVTFYKVGHHGAETSTTPDFLNVIKPRSAAASSGCKDVSPNKGYRHPRAVTLAALNAVVPGAGTNVRTLEAGKTQQNQWQSIDIHDGVYVTPVDGTFVLLADGGSGLVERSEAVSGALGICPQ